MRKKKLSPQSDSSKRSVTVWHAQREREREKEIYLARMTGDMLHWRADGHCWKVCAGL